MKEKFEDPFKKDVEDMGEAGSPEEEIENMELVMISLAVDEMKKNPNLYYLEVKDGVALVRKRADDSVFYRTDNKDDIYELEQVGVGK